MASTLRASFLIAVVVSICGCNSGRRAEVHERASSERADSTKGVLFNGEIEFKNTGSARLWVEVEGFEMEPPCGILPPSISKTSMMGPMALPPKIVLVWNKEGENKQRTVLVIPDDARRAITGKLLLEFDSDKKWLASYKPESP